MRIHHIAIWVDDLEVIKDFYTNYFDCTAGEIYSNPAKQFTSYFLSFSADARIEIMKRPNIPNSNKAEASGLTHFAIDVGTKANVDRLTEKIELDGFLVPGQPRFTGDGYYESVILDPEGNRVELIGNPKL